LRENGNTRSCIFQYSKQFQIKGKNNGINIKPSKKNTPQRKQARLHPQDEMACAALRGRH
jgi:hypothetical protein